MELLGTDWLRHWIGELLAVKQAANRMPRNQLFKLPLGQMSNTLLVSGLALLELRALYAMRSERRESVATRYAIQERGRGRAVFPYPYELVL